MDKNKIKTKERLEINSPGDFWAFKSFSASSLEIFPWNHGMAFNFKGAQAEIQFEKKKQLIISLAEIRYFWLPRQNLELPRK